MRVIIDDKIPFSRGILDNYAEAIYLPAEKISNNNLKSADALIIRSVTKCNEKLLRGTSVKFIATATIGFDHIDIDYCRNNGIVWKNAPGCNSTAVQQYTVNSIIHICHQYHLDYKKLTIGVVGVGHIGSKVVRSSEVLGLNVLMNDPPRARREGNNKFVDIETIKKESDIITFHVPLTMKGIDKTYYLANDDFLKTLRKNPFIINTSRGEVIDNNALHNAVSKKYIQKPILDVWENEPVINEGLAQNTLIATPHIAGYSIEGKARGSLFAILEIANFFHLNINTQGAEKIIVPEKKELIFDCNSRTIESLLNSTYSLINDHQLFIYNLHNFEKLRSEYNYRHDYSGYKVLLMNCTDEIENKIEKLGFELSV
ncbi:MAG: 4-phosphoerythronate dehydrogenase [Chlorobi bacterium]|nr:4-phosphoerythronate dehydrogenase [Chlorobiota bacterium]